MSLRTTRIDRSFYDHIRKGFVEKGLTPDVTTFSDDTAGFEAYKQALKDIQLNRGFAYELFGVEAPLGRGTEKAPRLVVHFNSLVPGDYGLSDNPVIEPTSNGFAEKVYPGLAYDYYLDVIILAKTQETFRAGMEALLERLPARLYVPYAEGLGDGYFLTLLESDAEISDSDHGSIGHLFSYKIPDVILTEPVEVGTISKIETIKVSISLTEYLGIPNTELIIS